MYTTGLPFYPNNLPPVHRPEILVYQSSFPRIQTSHYLKQNNKLLITWNRTTNFSLPETEQQNKTLPEIEEQTKTLPEIEQQNKPLPEIEQQNETLPEIAQNKHVYETYCI